MANAKPTLVDRKYTIVEVSTSKVLDMHHDPPAPERLAAVAAAYGLTVAQLAVHQDLNTAVLNGGNIPRVKVNPNVGALIPDVDAIREIEKAKLVERLRPLYRERAELEDMAADGMDVSALASAVATSIAALRAQYDAL